jgi:hypothetical protein
MGAGVEDAVEGKFGVERGPVVVVVIGLGGAASQ